MVKSSRFQAQIRDKPGYSALFRAIHGRASDLFRDKSGYSGVIRLIPGYSWIKKFSREIELHRAVTRDGAGQDDDFHDSVIGRSAGFACARLLRWLLYGSLK